jgi:hypothetical protein
MDKSKLTHRIRLNIHGVDACFYEYFQDKGFTLERSQKAPGNIHYLAKAGPNGEVRSIFRLFMVSNEVTGVILEPIINREYYDENSGIYQLIGFVFKAFQNWLDSIGAEKETDKATTKSDQPVRPAQKPDGVDPEIWDQWFDFYRDMQKKRVKYSYVDMGKDIGLAEDTIAHRAMEYRDRHNLDRNWNPIPNSTP